MEGGISRKKSLTKSSHPSTALYFDKQTNKSTTSLCLSLLFSSAFSPIEIITSLSLSLLRYLENPPQAAIISIGSLAFFPAPSSSSSWAIYFSCFFLYSLLGLVQEANLRGGRLPSEHFAVRPQREEYKRRDLIPEDRFRVFRRWWSSSVSSDKYRWQARRLIEFAWSLYSGG